MSKFIIVLFLLFSVLHLSAQKQKTFNIYLLAQQNWTMYDITKGNNPSGFGLGVQAFLKTRSKFRATMEITGDIYLMDDKVGRYRYTDVNLYSEIIPDVPSMINLFAGASYHPSSTFYLGVAAGPGFINNKAYVGFKPSIGFFTKNQRWTGKLSFINIFNRDFPTQSDFGSGSIAIGYRLH
jgi:hypothetical protein